MARLSETCGKVLSFLGCLSSVFLKTVASPSVLYLVLLFRDQYLSPLAICLPFQMLETGNRCLCPGWSFSVPSSERPPQFECYYILDTLWQLVVRCVWEGDLEKSFFYSCWDLEAERECFSMQVDGNWNYSYMNFWLFILDILLHPAEPRFSIK